ncbi:MAG: metal-dependent hydrolase [Terriglobales bacterium]
MEPVTHLLTGACMARAGFNRKTALATVTMVLAAEAPDIDAVTDFGGRIFAHAHHRGITHSFAGTPLVAGLVVLLIYLWYRWRRRGRRTEETAPRWGLLYALACLAVLSHLLLDFTNNYGVRPFEPFSYRWYSWDIVFIVEPLMWIALIAGLVLPSLFAVINQEIKSSRGKEPRGRWGAVLALVAVVVIWGVRDYQHRHAIAAMQALTYQGEPALRVSAYPYWFNPYRWYGVVETKHSYISMIVSSWTPEVDPDNRALVRYKPEDTPVTRAVKASYLGRVYLDWAQYPMMEVEPLQAPASGYLVRIYDVRYAYPGMRRLPLGGWVLLDSDLKVVAENFGTPTIPLAGREREQAAGSRQ